MKLVIFQKDILRRHNRNEDKSKSRKDESNKGYKDKGKKACYIAEEESKDELDDHDDEFVYVAMKDVQMKMRQLH